MQTTGDRDTVSGPLGPLAEALPHAETAAIDGLDHLPTPRSPEVTELAVGFLAGD